MTALSDKIKKAGIHDCNCDVYAISEAEARKAMNLVKLACIEAVKFKEINPNVSADVTTQHYQNGWYHSQASAIQAIRNVK